MDEDWLGVGRGSEENLEERIRGGIVVVGQCYRIDRIWYKERKGREQRA